MTDNKFDYSSSDDEDFHLVLEEEDDNESSNFKGSQNFDIIEVSYFLVLVLGKTSFE